jgi:hypothetical protein
MMFVRYLLYCIPLLLFAGCTREGPSSGTAAASHAAAAGDKPDMSSMAVPDSGRWRVMRPLDDATPMTPEQQAAASQLESLGYVAGSQEPRTNETVTIYDADRAWNGLNLFTSGHAPAAYLVDMNGQVVHRWFRDYRDIWPDADPHPAHGNCDFWRRARLLPDGGLLAIYEGMGIVRLDQDSNILWARRNGAHHDLRVMPDGTIQLLTRRAHLVPRINPTRPILEDFLTVLDADGNELRSISIVECFEHSPYAELGLHLREEGGDLTHTNTLRVLPRGRDYPVDWLQGGWILTSLRHPSVLAVIDPRRRVVVYAWQGAFRGQHDPSMVSGDRLLLFDNGSREGHSSRVLELDLRTLEIAWEYDGPPDSPLWSESCGTAARLPNGNTLITESDQGRALEVTHEGKVVWEFYNPFRVGEDPVYIATLFELTRLRLKSTPDWLAAADN